MFVFRTALAAALLGGGAGPVLAETIPVSPGQSIQAAVDRARAGDRVVVAPGTYSAFTIRRDGIAVVSAQPGEARIVSSGRAISAYGRSNITIQGFRVKSTGSDGIAVGGDADGGRRIDWVSNVRIVGNTVESAVDDGIKIFQMRDSHIVGNRVEWAGAGGTAGSAGNGNGDGGIDCVTCRGVLFQGNDVRTQGWAGLMLKTGSTGNRIVGNTFRNTDPRGAAIAVGGLSGGSAGTAAGVLGNSGSEASGNLIEGNTLNSADCGFQFIDAQNNRLVGNRVTQGRNCPTENAANNGASDVTLTGGPGGGGADAGPSWDGADPYNSSTARSLQGLAQGGCAASNAVGNVSAGIGAILGAGGRATAALQVAQQIQLLAQRICQQQMLLAQLRMLAGMDFRTFDDVLSALRRVEGMLTGVGLDVDLSPENIIRGLEQAYPDAFPDGTGYEAMEEQQIIWNDRVRDTLDGKTRIEHQVMVNRQDSMERVGRIEQAGRDSEGIRGAQLATNALLTELTGAVNDQITATTAHQRALAEVQYRQEAERAAAARDTADFMAPLAEECRRCGAIPMNLFGQPNPAGMARASGGRTANQVFGTGIQ